MGNIKDFVQILFKPLKKIFFGLIPTIYGIFVFIRDEFLPIDLKEKLRILKILNVIDWHWWVITGLSIWLIWTAWDVVKFRKNKSDLPIIKSEVKKGSQAIIIGRDNLAPIYQHQVQKRNIESKLPKKINLEIEPQEKIIDGKQYIIIVITNKEDKKVFCRIEINGIYDKTNKNILRDISQIANHFSWSGGNASNNGLKEILGGLDGTVNIGVIHVQGYGFNWFFYEDPNKNCQKAGIYKLNLAIKGTIGNIDFVRKKLNMEFEYIKKEERNSYGEFFNRGELKLLNWKVEN